MLHSPECIMHAGCRSRQELSLNLEYYLVQQFKNRRSLCRSDPHRDDLASLQNKMPIFMPSRRE